jgi:hypothetical protein
MNKRLEALIERVPTWSKAAQDEAVRALDAVERLFASPSVDADKLAQLRKMIDESIARGGSFTDEEVGTAISERLDAWERTRS